MNNKRRTAIKKLGREIEKLKAPIASLNIEVKNLMAEEQEYLNSISEYQQQHDDRAYAARHAIDVLGDAVNFLNETNETLDFAVASLTDASK